MIVHLDVQFVAGIDRIGLLRTVGDFLQHFELSVVFGIMFVFYVFLIVYCGTKLRRLRNRYSISA